MNKAVTSEYLRNTLKDLKSSLKNDIDLVKVKQLVKTELINSLGKENFSNGIYQGGLNKQELLNTLEEIFEKKNFLNGKYKGGKDLIISTIEELFESKNFINGKYQGGWNDQQDTANIHKVFKEENFQNGEYIGGWNKTQDAQNLTESLTNGEAKKLTSQLIEEKLGGAEKFQEGIYQSDKEITEVVKKGLQNKGEILRAIRNIFGEAEFFAEEPNESIPAGREGMRKDPEAIALQNAEREARIKSVEAWREFYQEHGIIDSTEKLFWSQKYGSDVKTAEGIYKDALLKGEEVVGGDFTKLEENRINKATTPDKIQEVLKDIPVVRRKKAWENFFSNHDTLGQIKEEWKENWRSSSLSIEVAKLIYNNGWFNSPNGLINASSKVIEQYNTEVLVMGKPYPQITKGIETLKHLAEEVDKVHEFIVKRIETETKLDKFPSEEEIKGAYQEKKVPDTRSWDEIGKIKDNKIKLLFKQYFQGTNPTKLDDSAIELWRVSSTGLANTGLAQRQAYDNGWIDPKSITNSKTIYQGIKEIEVLKTKKTDIDQEIGKVDSLVKEVNSYKFLRDLDAKQAEIDKRFEALQRQLLPPNKEQEVTNSVTKQRENLWYNLTDPQDGGLEDATLKQLATNLQNTWNVPNYEPMTVKKLNEFIAADKDVQTMGLFKEGVQWEDLSQSGWLKGQGGYELPKDKTAAEDKLHRDQKGAHLLKFFYEKAKDAKGYAFNPDKLTDKLVHFCQIGTKMVKRWKKKLMGGEWIEEATEVIGGDKGNAGHLAIGTGIGKTTKTINCLVEGGKRHVILVCPTRGLADSGFGHHISWLQRWGCVYHGGAKGVTEMAYVLRNSYTKATEQEIAEGKAEAEMKSIYVSHGSYPVAKNDLAYWFNANTGKNEGKEADKKGLSVMYFGYLAGFFARNLFVESGGINSWTDENLKKSVKEKLIPKEETIVVFDEAHFNDPSYQALQFQMIKAGYTCLRMSATFPGSEFSTTSTYPMKRVFSGRLDPTMPGGLMKIDNADQAEKLETLRGVPVGSIKYQDENGFPIPVEVNLEERIQLGRTWIFGKNPSINDEQRRLLGNNVAYMTYTPEFDEACEDVSAGRPNGSSDIVDESKEMGYTPPTLDTTICLGVVETTNLGRYFTYSEPTLGFTPISSLVQQMGRVARVKWGLAITLTKECGELDLSDNVSAAMIEALATGDVKKIEEKDYKQIYDVDILRGAMAYPDPKTFGKAPEEILMGLKITKEQQSKKEKLAQLVWRQDNEVDKKEAMAKPWYAIMSKDINPSEKLWNRYLGKSEAVTMGEEQAKNLLKEMFSNFITQDKKYPQGLDLKKQPEFINSVFGAKLDGGKKEEVIKETRTVLNGLVEAKVNELASKDYDETNKRSKNPNTIRKLAGLFKLTNANIDYQKMKNDEGKLVWTLLMKTA